MPLGPVWRDLSPVPLVVEVLPVAGEEAQLTGLRVDGETLVVLTVDHLPGLGVVPPGTRDLPHLAPGDRHLTPAVRLDAPLAVAELALGVVEHHLVAAAPVTAAGPDGGGRMSAHRVHTLKTQNDKLSLQDNHFLPSYSRRSSSLPSFC